MAVLFRSALSQEEQDDAQLKIEDILQMVSYDNIPNDYKANFNTVEIIYLQKSSPLLHFIVVRALFI